MKIDRQLNLVIPVERETGTLYVHSMPIGREVFERYFLVISKTFASIYSEGLNVMAGPRVAALMLRQTAETMGVWLGEDGVEAGLMAEIRRLSNVLTLGDNGWQMQPLQVALDRQVLDAEEVSEVENAIVFFTVASLMHHRSEREGVVTGAAKMWNAQISSQSIMELKASLQTLTETDNTGERDQPSSIPS